MRFVMALLFAVGSLALSVGCNDEKGPKKHDITGTVKFEGKEVSEGEIIFHHEDKTIGPEGGSIKDGKYSMKAREGKNTVEVRGTRVVPGKKGPLGEPWVEQFIPEQFNEKSTLSAEVKAGKTTHDFDLKK